MLFFSSTILPVENMAGFIYKISRFNPFVLSETALRKSIIYGLGIGSIWKEFLLLIIWSILVIGIILLKEARNPVKASKEAIKKVIFEE